MGRASGESTTPELCVTTRNIWRAGSSSHGAALACLAHTHQDKQVWPRAFRCFPQLSKALQPDAVLVHARAGSHEGHLPAHPASPATLQAHGTQHTAHKVQQNRAPCAHTRLFIKLQKTLLGRLRLIGSKPSLKILGLCARGAPPPGPVAMAARSHAGNSALFKSLCLLHNNPSVHLCPVVCFLPSIFMSALLQHARGIALRNDNLHSSSANKRKPRRGRDGYCPKCQPCPYANVHAKGSQWRC